MSATLTTANSVIVMTVAGLYPSGLTLSGYAADNVFEAGEVENGEFQMGIDGKLSAGFVFNEIPMTITLSADSSSLRAFEEIWARERANRDKLAISLSVTLPSLGRRSTLRNGFLRSYKAPAGQRILQPGVAVFTFGAMDFQTV